ncbi:hypothetical protein [Legionella moravica]|nr:hypothetical protein [Legionella moravica]
MVQSHKEMAHILGLKSNPFFSMIKNEGWYVSEAIKSIKNRFQQLKQEEHNNDTDLNFHPLNVGSLLNGSSKIARLNHGEYIGFSTGWLGLDLSEFMKGSSPFSGHAYTLHAVKEGDVTHFIYVNRGERHIADSTFHYLPSEQENGQLVIHEDDSNNIPTVMVFTVPNTEAESFANELISASFSIGIEGRQQMSRFLNQKRAEQLAHPEDEHVITANNLTRIITKKDQKTGNCTIANSNISWHFQLASDYMNQERQKGRVISFAQAYEATREEYKKMRRDDRVQAFIYLANDRESYLSKDAYFYNYLEALKKFQNKDQANQEIKHVDTLIEEAKKDEQTLINVIKPLVSEDFSINCQRYVDVLAERNKRMCQSFLMKHPNHAHADNIRFSMNQYPSYLWFAAEKARDQILEIAFKELPEHTQNHLVEKDSSLLKYATETVQNAFLSKDFNQYSLFASTDLKDKHPQKAYADEQCQGVTPDLIQSEISYQDFCVNTVRERKTDTNIMLAGSAAQKEARINNQIRALCSYAQRGDQANAKKAFESLCLTCCERRLKIPGRAKYSSDTQSVHWLMNKLSSDDRTVNTLRGILGIEPEQLKDKVDAIVARGNQQSAPGSVVSTQSRIDRNEQRYGVERRSMSEHSIELHNEFKAILESPDMIEPGRRLKPVYYPNVCDLLIAIRNNEDLSAIKEIASRGLDANKDRLEHNPASESAQLNNRITMFHAICHANSLEEALAHVKRKFPKYSLQSPDEVSASSPFQPEHRIK